MPTSHPYQLNDIIELIMLTNPRSMLDIGIGGGKYGFLAREYLETWGPEKKGYGERSYRIDGIEAHEPYLTDIHRAVYDEIHIGNALDVLKTMSTRYDLVIMIDVLEHCSYEDGIRLLSLVKERARNIIVSTPWDIGEQGDVFGNTFERHLHQWTRKDLAAFGPGFMVRNADSLLCYIGEQAAAVKRVRSSRRRRALVKSYVPWLPQTLRSLKKGKGHASPAASSKSA